mmetsp:Transcript_3296/g.10850  ORF Transcript_3296/g.10850 Transcript_3296/m.10850 type:complete len:235 (-) Transcript_3296:58-762(-)
MALLGVWSLRTPASTTSTSTETTTASAASGPSATTTTTTRTSTGAAKTMTTSSDATTIAAEAPSAPEATSTTSTRTIPPTSARTISSPRPGGPTGTVDVAPVRFGVDGGEDLASPDEPPAAPRPPRSLVARVTRDALSQVGASRVDVLAHRDSRTRGPVDPPAPPAALGDPRDPDPPILPFVLTWMTRKLELLKTSVEVAGTRNGVTAVRETWPSWATALQKGPPRPIPRRADV